MSKSTWDWLCKQSFGCILFANPKNSSVRPLPETIAGGDLDGDLYFICWDSVILNSLTQPDIQKSMKQNQYVGTMKPKDQSHKGSPKWLQEAQEMMIDTPRMKSISELTGKLYNLSVTTAKESNQHMHDDNARAFAQAYKDALDMAKHGSTVHLPAHLHDKVKPVRLRTMLNE